MKKTSFLIMLLAAMCSLNAQTIQRVEPLSWWTDMRCPLTIMFQGSDLCDATVSVTRVEGKKQVPTQGLVVKGQHNAESPNYLFVDVDVREAGKYVFTLKKGKKSAKYTYEINTRRPGSADRKSFTTEDVIYLIMSDRFVDGDESNNTVASMAEPANKESLDGRWGGDIQGIINSLDHIKKLGATTIWPTPLLVDNQSHFSYHGYACGDYYHIDPRFGTNELYREMVAKAHEKGLKFVMDIVTNHCGTAHWWMQDLPYQDWIHQFPEFTRAQHQFITNYDINASKYDLDLVTSAWFDTSMPDMNLDNPDLLQYYKQWAIWWIEYADLDGLRVDTYPYNEKVPMSEWCKAVRTEYPNINIVGEVWTSPASAIAYWQADALNYDGFNSNLPSVMDFPLSNAIRAALGDNHGHRGGSLGSLYDVLNQDYQYADVNHLMTFVDNHDMDRITDVVADKSFARAKLAAVLLATLRGIPQIFAGDEYGQLSADTKRGHSGLRRPLKPATEWTAEEADMFDFQSKLWTWRQSEPVLHHGKTMHFVSHGPAYAFVRYTDDEAILVIANGSDQEVTNDLKQYQEILKCYQPFGVDHFTGEKVCMEYIPGNNVLTIKPLSARVIKLSK